MSTLIFGNNDQTTIAGAITNAATTVNLSPGAGALFPQPTSGQYFVATFNDAATGLLNEIVWVTNITGDVATIVRAQEGTTALAWNAGDIFSNFWTAGQASAMLQTAQGQAQGGNYAVDTGAANAYVVALTPALTTRVAGLPIRVKAANSNTTASTLNYGAGAVAIQYRGAALTGGEIVAGRVFEVVDDGTVLELQSSQVTQIGTTHVTATNGTGSTVALIASPTFTGTLGAATISASADISAGTTLTVGTGQTVTAGGIAVNNGSNLGIRISQTGGPQIVSGGSTPSLLLGGSGAVSFGVSTNEIFPNTDNFLSNGDITHRWTTVFATNGTINTSDRNEKQAIVAAIKNPQLVATAKKLRDCLVTFKWNHSVEEKGLENARTHIGVIAQDVVKAFADVFGDPNAAFKFGAVCRDEITEDAPDIVKETVRQQKMKETTSPKIQFFGEGDARIAKWVPTSTMEPEFNEVPLIGTDGKPVLNDAGQPVVVREPVMEDVVIEHKLTKRVGTGKFRYSVRPDQIAYLLILGQGD